MISDVCAMWYANVIRPVGIVHPTCNSLKHLCETSFQPNDIFGNLVFWTKKSTYDIFSFRGEIRLGPGNYFHNANTCFCEIRKVEPFAKTKCDEFINIYYVYSTDIININKIELLINIELIQNIKTFCMYSAMLKHYLCSNCLQKSEMHTSNNKKNPNKDRKWKILLHIWYTGTVNKWRYW